LPDFGFGAAVFFLVAGFGFGFLAEVLACRVGGFVVDLVLDAGFRFAFPAVAFGDLVDGPGADFGLAADFRFGFFAVGLDGFVVGLLVTAFRFGFRTATLRGAGFLIPIRYTTGSSPITRAE